MKTRGPGGETPLDGPGCQDRVPACARSRWYGRCGDGRRRGGPEGCGAYGRIRTLEGPKAEPHKLGS